MLTPTNSKITGTFESHVFSHAGACMQIQESMKGEYSTYIISRGLGVFCRKILRFSCHERAFDTI